MILSDKRIIDGVESGDITISDFDIKRINPASYDVLLGKQIAMYLPKCNDKYKLATDYLLKFLNKTKGHLTLNNKQSFNGCLTVHSLVETFYKNQPFGQFCEFIHFLQQFIIIDPLYKNTYDAFTFDIPKEGFVVRKNHFYLYSIKETIGSKIYASEIKNKSSLARLSLLIHFVASWIDPGFVGKITLEVSSWFDIILRPGMKIGQIIFHTVSEIRERYDEKIGSKYMNQEGVQPSKYSENYGKEGLGINQ